MCGLGLTSFEKSDLKHTNYGYAHWSSSEPTGVHLVDFSRASMVVLLFPHLYLISVLILDLNALCDTLTG